MLSVTDSTELAQAVAEARGTGAGALKLYRQLSAPLVRRVVAEAHRQRLPVWSHLFIDPAEPLEVVEAGTDVVSHAYHLAAAMGPERYRALLADSAGSPIDVDDPAIDRLRQAMVQHGTILDATLFISKDTPREREVAGVLLAKAHAAGVRITAGSDTQLGASDPSVLPNLHEEMELLVELGGLTPAEALRAATATAASAADVLGSRGTIEVGKLADMVVLDANPLESIVNTKSVRLVIKRGRVYQRH